MNMMRCRQYWLYDLRRRLRADLIILLVDKLASYRVLEKEDIYTAAVTGCA
jgi:hypothetical protein